MKKSNKVISCVLALMSSFSYPAFALIIEGSFSGTTGYFINENMNATPDAKFWHENENAYQPFTGSFWYDTDLAGPAFNSPYHSGLVTFSQQRDWLHTTLVGANGESLELTSRGSLPNFSKHPKDSVSIHRHDDEYSFYDRLTMFYTDVQPPPQRWVTLPYRSGSVLVVSNTPILDGLDLIQNFEFSSEQNGNNPVGYVHFHTLGVINGVDYEGEFSGQLNKFEIHVREPVSIPEPSSLLLFLLPLVFLFWRADLLSARQYLHINAAKYLHS